MHVGDDFAGPFLLSLGITSARDPGNDNTLTLARAERRAKGDLLSPKIYPSLLIDGKGPNSSQTGTVVTSSQEAIVAVQRARADGFTGIKFYGTYNPEWVASAATEAHRLGLHVHGHVPAGMRPSQAIAAGYDELTHIYFVMMEAMPDSVVATSNGINRFDGIGRYAKDVDLNASPIKSLIAMMATRKIASRFSTFGGFLSCSWAWSAATSTALFCVSSPQAAMLSSAKASRAAAMIGRILVFMWAGVIAGSLARARHQARCAGGSQSRRGTA